MRSDLRPGSRRNHGEGSEPRSARAARLRRCAATIALSKAKSTHRSRAPSLGSSLRRRVAQPFCRRSVGLGRRSANRTGDTEAPSHGLDRGHGVRGQDSRCIEALLSIAHARDGVAQEDPGAKKKFQTAMTLSPSTGTPASVESTPATDDAVHDDANAIESPPHSPLVRQERKFRKLPRGEAVQRVKPRPLVRHKTAQELPEVRL